MVSGVHCVRCHPPEETYPVLGGRESTHGGTPWFEQGSGNRSKPSGSSSPDAIRVRPAICLSVAEQAWDGKCARSSARGRRFVRVRRVIGRCGKWRRERDQHRPFSAFLCVQKQDTRYSAVWYTRNFHQAFQTSMSLRTYSVETLSLDRWASR